MTDNVQTLKNFERTTEQVMEIIDDNECNSSKKFKFDNVNVTIDEQLLVKNISNDNHDKGCIDNITILNQDKENLNENVLNSPVKKISDTIETFKLKVKNIIKKAQVEVTEINKNNSKVNPQQNWNLPSTSNQNILKNTSIKTQTVEVIKLESHWTGKCHQCMLDQHCKYMFTIEKHEIFLCSDSCFLSFQALNKSYNFIFNKSEKNSFRRCSECLKLIKNFVNIIKWQMMEFCMEACLEKFQRKNCMSCVYCKKNVLYNSIGKYCVRFGYDISQFCNNNCLELYKLNKRMCRYCQKIINATDAMIVTNDKGRYFCTMKCLQFYGTINCKNKIVTIGTCSECTITNYLPLQLEFNDTIQKFCSDKCFYTYTTNNNLHPLLCYKCKIFFIKKNRLEFTIYDETIKYFCSKICQNVYIIRNGEFLFCYWCKTKKYNFDLLQKQIDKNIYYTCSLKCLRLYQEGYKIVFSQKLNCYSCLKDKPPRFHMQYRESLINLCSKECIEKFCEHSSRPLSIYDTNKIREILGIQNILPEQEYFHCVVTKEWPVPKYKNKSISCKPILHDKEIQNTIDKSEKNIQTDECPIKTRFVPLPIPIYVPSPIPLHKIPLPTPTPFPLPFPVPILIPLTKSTYTQLQKEWTSLKKSTVNDPLQADLLKMAELLAEETKPEINEIKLPDLNSSLSLCEIGFDDIINMNEQLNSDLVICEEIEVISSDNDIVNTVIFDDPIINNVEVPLENLSLSNDPEKLSNLNCNYGVFQWQKWCQQKPDNDKRLQNRKFEIIKLTPSELDYYLCKFVKEVRKPNGYEYSPDIIYYLCLCIQKYLQRNGRKDMIFNDQFYDNFNICFNEISKKFINQFYNSNLIVTRVVEDYLWETNQLGLISPIILINTLIYFNTMYFNLQSIEKHSELSFLDIMKQWKKYTDGKKRQSLRYYPKLKANNTDRNRCKKYFDAPENLENSDRCPIKVYDFYLSKCPEVVKKSNDCFYLQPERYFIPDSPVWFSSKPLDVKILGNVFNRFWMVKEIGISLLSKDD